eukprot:592090-Amphidinium_carterae.1
MGGRFLNYVHGEWKVARRVLLETQSMLSIIQDWLQKAHFAHKAAAVKLSFQMDRARHCFALWRLTPLRLATRR